MNRDKELVEDSRDFCPCSINLRLLTGDPDSCWAKAESLQAAASLDELLSYQLSIVVYWTTMAFTGDGESEFDSGEEV